MNQLEEKLIFLLILIDISKQKLFRSTTFSFRPLVLIFNLHIILGMKNANSYSIHITNPLFSSYRCIYKKCDVMSSPLPLQRIRGNPDGGAT
jgi:hypothetical protein